mmetsp:Transcript_20229/g.51052  ORF Transcript_20229/g.51052 Transcript_20229/m.51052 type:complete len:230 (-) Transcript_20229:249-938(-)
MFLRLILLNKCKIKKQLRSASGNFHQSVAEDSPSGPASLSFREEDPADSSACGRGAGVSNSSVSSVARTLAFADSLIALADALSEAFRARISCIRCSRTDSARWPGAAPSSSDVDPCAPATAAAATTPLVSALLSRDERLDVLAAAAELLFLGPEEELSATFKPSSRSAADWMLPTWLFRGCVSSARLSVSLLSPAFTLFLSVLVSLSALLSLLSASKLVSSSSSLLAL